jgi:hypothetical protein
MRSCVRVRACSLQSLLSKAIKHEERMNDLPRARSMLYRLHEVGLDKCWRTLLEGAQLEARAGNSKVARIIFKYLMEHVQWCGPVYSDAVRYEERCGNDMRALRITDRCVRAVAPLAAHCSLDGVCIPAWRLVRLICWSAAFADRRRTRASCLRLRVTHAPRALAPLL